MADLLNMTPAMADLCRRTVAKDCNNDEFSLFLHTCKAIGLDPLRRQIYAMVFSKDNAARRNMSIITAIDGYRTVSDRSGKYLPDEEEPEIEMHESRCTEANPKGIIKAKVYLRKFAAGSWHRVPGVARWEEFVPLVHHPDDLELVPTGEVWEDSGKPKMRKVAKPDARMIIDPSREHWIRAPFNKIAICAEAQAHRRGWPNDFAGVQVEEEVHRLAALDLTGSELADIGARQRREALVGAKDTVLIDFLDADPTVGAVRVSLGQAHDRIDAFLRNCDGPRARLFRARNINGLNDFHSADPRACHEVKKILEKAEARPAAKAQPVLTLPPPQEQPLILPAAEEEAPAPEPQIESAPLQPLIFAELPIVPRRPDLVPARKDLSGALVSKEIVR